MLDKIITVARLVGIGVLILALVNGCGWRLRGQLALPEGLDSVYINNQSQSESLKLTLEEVLRTNQVAVSESMRDARIVINIESQKSDRRTATLSAGARVSEYELSEEVNYSIENGGGEILIPSSEASIIRTYQYNENDVVAARNEEQLIKREMQQELAQQILRRLRFIDFSANE